MSISRVVAIILAGGKGSRLGPIISDLPKPAVPFGNHRIIDYMISNAVNSGFRKILVAAQYLGNALNLHIEESWPSAPIVGFSIRTVHPQQANGTEDWYKGTADAVYQNIGIIKSQGIPEDIAIFSGDHIVVTDFGQMYDYHLKMKSRLTICAMKVPVHEASRFGVIEVDSNGRAIGFVEKPARPKEIPNEPGWAWASMGNYFAHLETLEEALNVDMQRNDTGYDFGKDIIPYMIENDIPVFVYSYHSNVIAGQDEHYWRDVGTIRSYWEALMDLASIKPSINLFNPAWPIRTPSDNLPMGTINYSSGCFRVSSGAIVEHSEFDKVLIGRSARIYRSNMRSSVVFDGVHIGEGCDITNAIICADIPPGTVIGHNRADDEARGFYFDEKDPSCNVVIIPRNYKFN